MKLSERRQTWAVVAFQPAVLYDSAVWAQTDSAITAAMLAAIVLAASGRSCRAGAAFALGLAVKPRPIIIAPIVALLLWRNGGFTAFCGQAVAASPWRWSCSGRGSFTARRDRLSACTSSCLRSTGSASRNSPGMYGGSSITGADPRPETEIVGGIPIAFQRAGLLLGMLAAALATAYAWRRPGLRSALIATAYIALAFYELPVGSHERYLYPLLGLLLPVIVVVRDWRWRSLSISHSQQRFS